MGAWVDGLTKEWIGTIAYITAIEAPGFYKSAKRDENKAKRGVQNTNTSI